MANEEHLKVFFAGVDAWNKWRKDNPKVTPDLSGHEFENSQMEGANLSNAILDKSSYRQVTFSKAKFANSHMRDCVFERSVLTNADFSHADLRGTHFYSMTLDDVEFHDADLRGAQLNDGVLITNEQLSRAITDKTTVVKGPIYDKSNNEVQVDDATHDHSADSVSAEEGLILSDEFTVLKGNEIVEILERGVDYWNDWRKQNNIDIPNLKNTNLIDLNLKGANLKNADLSGAVLTQANLSNADLSGANLSNTTLAGTILSGANLEQTIFDEADLRATNFADLDSDLNLINPAKGLTLEQLNSAYPDYHTIVPNYIPKEWDVGPEAYISSDRWTTEDALGYNLYAHAISLFLKHKKTTPPLTISIQAPWGGGKSSLMKMIKKELDSEHPSFKEKIENTKTKERFSINNVLDTISANEKEGFIVEPVIPEKVKKKEFLTVWFNPWKYETTDQIWAGLADAFIKQLTERLEPWEKEKFWFQLNLNRIDTDKVRLKIHEKIVNIWFEKMHFWLIGYGLALLLTFLIGLIYPLSFTLTGASFLIGLFHNIRVILTTKSQIQGEPASVSLREYIKVPDYSEKLGFIHQAEEDIKTVYDTFDQGKGQKTIVIFIDDLDRCSPTKIAAVFEGINLFLASGFIPCFFIIGMDAEMVAAALNEAHSDVIKHLPSYASGMSVGSRYMDKFVQLPFIIPPPTKGALDEYTESLLTTDDKAKENVAKAFEVSQLPDNNDDIDVFVRASVEKGEINPEDEDYARSRLKKNLDNTRNRRTLEKQIEKYSDNNPNIQEQIINVSKEFSNNPRELKRFINAYRYNYFIRSAINAQRRPEVTTDKYEPLLNQITNWMILSMRWPELARWLQHNYARRASSLESSKNVTEMRLNILMELCNQKDSIDSDGNRDENGKSWGELVEEKLGLKLEEAH